MSVGRRSLSRAVLVLIAVLLVLAAAGTAGGQTTSKGSDVFDDVPAGHWADVPIGWAVQNDITRGVGAGRFGLEDIVNRAQIVTFLYRTVNHFRGASEDPPQNGSSLFGDVPAGHWAAGPIGWAVSKGLIEGVDDGVFGLQSTVPRSEIVALLHRTVNLIQGKPLTTRPENKIAFTRNGYLGPDIYVMDADGGNRRQLTTGGNNVHPAWSPDGTQIAFERWGQDERGWSQNDIFVMDADGGNQRQLTTDGQSGGPTWSPDGTKIAFKNFRGWQYDIFVMDADGGNQRQLTDQTTNDSVALWSPDGTQIAFTGNHAREVGGDASNIYVMDADGGNRRQLTTDRKSNHPTWSPDGTKIAFTNLRGSQYHIFVMDADGGNRRQLTTDEGYRPKWSPDGTQIAFSIWLPLDYAIFVMDADGGNRRQLTTDGQSADPTWSPDGTKIAFKNFRRSIYDIFVMDADGGNRRQLTTDDQNSVGSPSWSPHTRGSTSFDDVSPQHQADSSIGWAVTNGITSGIGNRMFDPDGTVDRAQIVTFLYRTANLLRNASGT